MEKSTISKIANVSNLIPIIGLIILNFCPIIVMKRAQSDSIRVDSLVCPFLSPYSVSTVFLLLIPLILYLLLTVVSFFVRSKRLSFLGLLFSIYVLFISVCVLCVFKFTLAGAFLGLLFAMMMVALSVFKICVNRYERKNI